MTSRTAAAAASADPCAPPAAAVPSHIDVQLGRWAAAFEANERAAEADAAWLARTPGALGDPYLLNAAHTLHFLVWVGMMAARRGAALGAADRLLALVSAALRASPAEADRLEAFAGLRWHVLVRFGDWDEILSGGGDGAAAAADDDDPRLYCVTAATACYARTVAAAAVGDAAAAAAHLASLDAAIAAVPRTRALFNNASADMLAAARPLAAGEAAFRGGGGGGAGAGLALLRTAVALGDRLAYDEPPGLMHPPRHALGALLLEAGRPGEALSVFRTDLGLEGKAAPQRCHPANPWALRGVADALRAMAGGEGGGGGGVRAAEAEARAAAAGADVPVRAACACARARGGGAGAGAAAGGGT